MQIRLLFLKDIPADWQTVHAIRAIEVDGRADVIGDLDMLKRGHNDDYKKLLRAFRTMGQEERVTNVMFVKRSAQYPDIYEARGGKARVFFFYGPGKEELVVCTNQYWKTKPSEKEQNAAFERCRRLRNLYLAHMAATEKGKP